MYDILREALPEFLGSLAAGAALAMSAWIIRKIRDRHSATDQSEA
ncbi:hypothetical protein ABZ725_52235 [Streptomyces sp. NPDC006872]